MKRTDYIVLWPIYFDSTKSRSEGRKVPKSLALPSPKLEELVEAVKRLGLNYIVEEEKRYPRFWWETRGRLLVERRERKSLILKNVARELRSLRKERSF